MKKFLTITTVIVLVVFGLGLATTAIAGNWTAFCWVITATLWFVYWLIGQIESESSKEQYEEQLQDLRKNRDDYKTQAEYYWDKYDEKLQENLDLAQENVDLCQKNLMLAEKNKMMSEYIQKNLPGYQGDPDIQG